MRLKCQYRTGTTAGLPWLEGYLIAVISVDRVMVIYKTGTGASECWMLEDVPKTQVKIHPTAVPLN